MLSIVFALAALASVCDATCLGTSCKDNEDYAKAHGLLGAEQPQGSCRGRDRTFSFKPEWQVRVQPVCGVSASVVPRRQDDNLACMEHS
jgi:hypothetical protein